MQSANGSFGSLGIKLLGVAFWGFIFLIFGEFVAGLISSLIFHTTTPGFIGFPILVVALLVMVVRKAFADVRETQRQNAERAQRVQDDINRRANQLQHEVIDLDDLG